MHRMIYCAAGAAAALLFAGTAPALAATNCNLGNGIKHIVYLQFDNVHLRRDNPNVPSDSFGNDGFPSSFSPTPSQTLGYAAKMLETGVPVLYLYIEDAHDNHHYPNAPTNPDGTFGPGEAGYVAQLQAYESAFSKFFARLQAHGITQKTRCSCSPPTRTTISPARSRARYRPGAMAFTLPAATRQVQRARSTPT